MRKIFAVSLVMVCGFLGTHARAQPAPDHEFPFLLPGSPASSLDEIFVAYWMHCHHPQPDLLSTPTVAVDGSTITVDMILLSEVHLCGTPPPAEPIVVSLGKLPNGVYEIVRRLSTREDNTLQLVHEDRAELVVDPSTPHAGVSGAWFDPVRPGTGIVIQRMSTWLQPSTVLLTTMDANGAPLWLAGTGQFASNALVVPLYAPSADGDTSSAQPFGTLTFEYSGCATAHVSWTGPTLRFPVQVPTLVRQLTSVAEVNHCGMHMTPWTTED